LDDTRLSAPRRRFRPRMGSISLSVLTAVYILAVANQTFWSRAFDYLSFVPTAFAGFIVGIAAITMAAFTTFSVKYLIKPALIFFVMVAVLSSWFTDQFGVVIDKEMIRNAAVTTHAESAHLITPSFLLHILLAGMLPSLFIIWVEVVHKPFLKKFVWNMAVIMPCLMVFVAVGLSFSQTYASVGRLHRDLMLTLNPFIPIGSVARFVFASEEDRNIVRRPLGTDAHQRSASANGKPRVTIIVAGETGRAQNFSLGGYPRETNPEMKARGVVYFSNATSCGTSTAVSLPCMYSVYPRSDYTHRKGLETDNLTDILGHAKINVEWWDNDTGSYGVANRIPYRFLPDAADPRFCTDGECLDTVLLDKLDSWLANVKSDSVLVLHQLGATVRPTIGVIPMTSAASRPTAGRRVRRLQAGGDRQRLRQQHPVHRPCGGQGHRQSEGKARFDLRRDALCLRSRRIAWRKRPLSTWCALYYRTCRADTRRSSPGYRRISVWHRASTRPALRPRLPILSPTTISSTAFLV
jgi:lipid A ethanolaminephosphotransferase